MMRALGSSLLTITLLTALGLPVACSSEEEAAPKKEKPKADDDDDSKGDDSSEPGPATCLEGTTDDCDGDEKNGCETSLTKEGNCGACGRACAPGSCLNGKCTPGLIDDKVEIRGGLASDGSGNVVFAGTRETHNGVFTVSTKKLARPLFQSGDVTIFAESVAASAQAITYVTWDGTTTKFYSSPLNGGTETELHSCTGEKPSATTVGPDAIWWWQSPSDSGLGRVGLDGAGGAAEVCPHVYDAAKKVGGRGVAVSNGFVYWAEATTKKVMRRPDAASGGTATSVADGEDFATTVAPGRGEPSGALAADANGVYWTTETGVRGFVKDVVVDVATDVPGPQGLSLDDKYVYFTVDGTSSGGTYAKDGSVVRVLRTGGEPEVLANKLVHPTALVGDGTSLFFVVGAKTSGEAAKTTLMRLAK